MTEPDRVTFTVFNQPFTIDNRFEIMKEVGHGAYGIVCSARYTLAPEQTVAIKKVTNIFSKKILTKRALRELKLLRHFRGHKNITCLYDLDIVDKANFNEVYLYEELMECDMHQIIRSGQPLTDAHYQSFTYQILCGLKYIHSADVLHRDLKPGNLLVNADCELKICDFGLARGYSSDPEKNNGFLTEYVATRWYRAPEIMLSLQSYTKAIDVWSVGCILAELLGGKPIFKGKDYVDQLNQILYLVGTPNEETLRRIGSQRAQDYVRSLGYMPKVPFSKLYPQANPLALNLLDKMLNLDPESRITVDEALEHPYLKVWHDPEDEPVCLNKFDFKFEEVDDLDQMRTMILQEVEIFREYVRKPIEEQESDLSAQQQYVEEQQHQHPQQDQISPQHQYQQDFNPQYIDQQTPQYAQTAQQGQQLSSSPAIPLGIPSDQFLGDLPPRPFENQMLYDGVHKQQLHHQEQQQQQQGNLDDFFGLEQELEFGLDAGFQRR